MAFLKETKWPAVLQQRRMLRGMADWWVTTSDPPPVSHGRWNGRTLLIRAEEMRKERLKRTKKTEQVASDKDKCRGGAVDEVFSSDPWACMKSRQKSRQSDQDKSGVSPSGSAPSSAAPSTPSASQAGVSIASGPRLSALTARMDSYEKKHADLASKVGELDGKIEGLGVSMRHDWCEAAACLLTKG